MRLSMVFGAIYSIGSAVVAQTVDAENDSRTAEYVNKRMTLTMVCETAIGPAWYQSSRTMGLVKISSMVGMTKREAHKLISDVEKRLRTDKHLPELQKKADTLGCMTALNDLDFEYGDIK